MSVRTPDHALRRLVADLAAAAPEDVEAILAPLSEDHRRRVQDLLQSFVGEPAGPPSPIARETQSPQPSVQIEGLSPWLAARLQQADAPAGRLHGARSDERREHGMTPTAMAALRDAAAAVAARQAPALSSRPAKASRAVNLRRIFSLGRALP